MGHEALISHQLNWTNPKFYVFMSGVKGLFRSPTCVSFVDCNLSGSTPSLQLSLMSIPWVWQLPHLEISNTMILSFTALHSGLSEPPRRDTPDTGLASADTLSCKGKFHNPFLVFLPVNPASPKPLVFSLWSSRATGWGLSPPSVWLAWAFCCWWFHRCCSLPLFLSGFGSLAGGGFALKSLLPLFHLELGFSLNFCLFDHRAWLQPDISCCPFLLEPHIFALFFVQLAPFCYRSV